MQPDTSLNVDSVIQREREVILGEGDLKRPPSALCISGGGIRSATFALGALQGMAERGILRQFDYLSTVSGGGYIGSWLTAWVHRVGSIEAVELQLKPDARAPAKGQPNPVQHLREYNSYLAPRSGAFSADLWTVIATVSRNIFLNWLVLIPLLLFALTIPRLYLALLSFPGRVYRDVIFVNDTVLYAAPELNPIVEDELVALATPIASGLLLAIALFNILRYLPGIGGRDHTRSQYVIGILLPLVLAVLMFLVFDALYYLGKNYQDYSNLGEVLLWTTAPFVLAWLVYLPLHRNSARSRTRLVFSPLSLAVAALAAGTGIATWVITNFVLWNPDPTQEISWAVHVTIGPPLILLGIALATFLFVGLSSDFLEDEDREWMARAVAGILMAGVGWAAASFIVLVAPQWIVAWQSWAPGAIVLASLASAWLSTLGGSAAANTNPAAVSKRKPFGISSLIRFAPLAFIVLFGVLLSIFTNVMLLEAHSILAPEPPEVSTPVSVDADADTNPPGLPSIYAKVARDAVHSILVDESTGFLRHGLPDSWDKHDETLNSSSIGLVALLAIVFLTLSMVMARFINSNTFSLHGMYRDRLIRAYLGASNPARRASRFTGFSKTDDVRMGDIDPSRKPFHVLNLTLNLVSTTRLAWQQRKAASFTVSPLHSGSAELGYRSSSKYGGGISLGSALATSGAAASPNMGYNSSPLIGFIMTLFNARLGSWLGNPGAPGERTWTEASPHSATLSLMKEAMGLTSDDKAYVYLSDGGHFENLGLYEMVRRRCGQIVVLDCGCDPDFQYDDLGNALRKIRIDFGIPIVFESEDIRPLHDRQCRAAVARIEYSAAYPGAAPGALLYLKPMLRGNEPPDVQSYAASNPTFPHQSTADQFFNESQTESYRELGLFTVQEICKECPGKTLDELFAHVQQEYIGKRPGSSG